MKGKGHILATVEKTLVFHFPSPPPEHKKPDFTVFSSPPLVTKFLLKQHIFKNEVLVVFFGSYHVPKALLGNSGFLQNRSILRNAGRTVTQVKGLARLLSKPDQNPADDTQGQQFR